MTSLAALLADPSREIAFVCQLEERDPDTDTVTTRSYATANWRGGEGYARYLMDPGGRSDRLEADELAAVASQQGSPVQLLNLPIEPGGDGPLDFLRARSLAGRAITILAGAPDEAIANYEPVASGVMDKEPVFDGNLIEIRIKSALERLDVDLDVGTYVGEPGALRVVTSGTGGLTADNAAHHLTEFTLAGRVWVESHATGASGGASVTAVLIRRLVSATSYNWALNLRGTGFPLGAVIEASVSSGGVGNKRLLRSTALATGQWYEYVYAARSGHTYLMLNGAVVAEDTTTDVPDTPTAGIEIGESGGGVVRTLDHRIFNHYIAPDEMRAAMAVRASGDEEGLVGLWRGDDNTGSTVTDYSDTAAHATVSGTEGVDFEWVSSDLGTEELAGRSMPVIMGAVVNAPADLVDSFRERWRVSDTDISEPAITSVVRDEGEDLSAATDHDWDGDAAVFELASEAGEPVTVGRTTSPASHHITLIGAEVLAERGPLAAGEHDESRLLAIYGNTIGLHTRRRRVREIHSEIVAGGVGFVWQDREGIVISDVLVPPTSPSPRDGACLEISSPAAGGASSSVQWSTGSFIASNSFTVCAWLKTHRWGPTDATDQRVNILDNSARGDGAGFQFAVSLRAGAPRLILERWAAFGASAAVSAEARYGSLRGAGASQWHFVAAVNDQVGGEVRFYAAREGTALRLIGTHPSGLGFGLPPSLAYLAVGGVASGTNSGDNYFRGGVLEPQLWSDTRTLAELQALMDAAPAGTEPGLEFFAPLDGIGAASTADAVTGGAASVTGDVVERPDLVLDLRTDPHPYTDRRVRPAHEIRVEYRRNYAPLDPGQIAATVAQDDAQDLQTPARYESWKSPEVAEDYLDSRAVTIPALWATRHGARAALRMARHRFDPDRLLAELKAVHRRGLLLGLNDEVRVYRDRGLEEGPVYRVISNHSRHAELISDLGLWR